MFKRGALYFAILASALAFLRSVLVLPARPVEIPRPACVSGNAEALLACNRPLRYKAADQGELELVPGMTAKMSALFAAGRDQVLQKAGASHPKRPYEPFEVLPGIGPKRAEKFGPYLSLR